MSEEYRVFYSNGVRIIVFKGRVLAAGGWRVQKFKF